jgi:phthalate 4,5-dioxygenase oxygenase subunit
MLNAADNELLTRVGPGTPMGRLMREYWIPAALSGELPTPDGDPVRVLLLGEKLIAFRDAAGKIGLIQNHCPHRGASLFFGRNEEAGLRCVYHGWKFDVSGQCVDMPNEPAESDFKTKVKTTAYPCVERNGLIWTYMGPRSTPPPLPDIEPNMVPDGGLIAQMAECNWLQKLENNMDTSHASFLHWGAVPVDAPWEPWMDSHKEDFRYMLMDRSPRFQVLDTESGASYAAGRPVEAGQTYYRIMNFHFPFYSQSPSNDLKNTNIYVAVVPQDDTHTISFTMSTRPWRWSVNFGITGTVGGLLPNTTDWLGRFRPAVNLANDLMIDREAQRTDRTYKGYTGIESVNDQDRGITESQGEIQDRTTERLGTADAMIIRARRRLQDVTLALHDRGITPPGVDQPEAYRRRSGHIVLPSSADVWQATKELREAFPIAAGAQSR